MILAFHIILSAYGFWLPNDPRGSWSEFVGAWELFHYGRATKVNTRHSVARRPHDRKARFEAKKALKYEPVRFSGVQARAIAQGFGRAACESGYVILACAILPDHVHLIVARLTRPISQVVGHLKARASQELRADGIHPFETLINADGEVPTVWAGRYWKVFIDNAEHLEAAIKYVQDNPLKEGKQKQNWKFVQPADQRSSPTHPRGKPRG
jgi:REP element-mobilizing transposase RayT